MHKGRIRSLISQITHSARAVMIPASMGHGDDELILKITYTDGKSGDELTMVIKVWKPSRAIYAVNLRVNVADADLVFEAHGNDPRAAISAVYAQAEAWVDRLVVTES